MPTSPQRPVEAIARRQPLFQDNNYNNSGQRSATETEKRLSTMTMTEEEQNIHTVTVTKDRHRSGGSVRFNEKVEVIVHDPAMTTGISPPRRNASASSSLSAASAISSLSSSSAASASPSPTWLSPSDYECIQDCVFMTIDAIEMIKEDGGDDVSKYHSSFCSRGLEQYCTQNNGSMKESVLARRHNAIDAVLHEQDQQRRMTMKQSSLSSWEFVPALSSQDLLYNANSIREVYERYGSITSNTNEAIRMGIQDAVEAFSIHNDQQQQKHQQQRKQNQRQEKRQRQQQDQQQHRLRKRQRRQYHDDDDHHHHHHGRPTSNVIAPSPAASVSGSCNTERDDDDGSVHSMSSFIFQNDNSTIKKYARNKQKRQHRQKQDRYNMKGSANP